MSGELVSSICAECGADLTFAPGQAQVQCGYCDGGMAVGNGRLIRLDCPACRGNFYYVDGSMSGRCPYCEASLLALTRQRVLRYVIAPAAPRPVEGAELKLLPFWRLTGLLHGYDIGAPAPNDPATGGLSSDHRVIGIRAGRDGFGAMRDGGSVAGHDTGPVKHYRGRVVDLSLADASALQLGVTSLRLRAQVFAMEALTAEHLKLGAILPTRFDLAAARQLLYAQALDVGRAPAELSTLECQRADLLAESLSVLYYPFWVLRRPGAAPAVWDGRHGEAEPVSGQRYPDPPAARSAIFDDLRVIELACGHCREPLPRGNHAAVYPCGGCGRFWHCGRDGLAPFAAYYARPAQPDPKMVWLPFWRMGARVGYAGKQAATVGELRNVLGVRAPPCKHPSEPGDAALAFYVPAFGGLRHPRMDFAARDLTRLQPRLEQGRPQAGEVYTCFHGPEDARQLAYSTWIQILPGTVPRWLRSLRVAPGEPALWYLPFGDRGRELVNLVTGASYDRGAFRGVRH